MSLITWTKKTWKLFKIINKNVLQNNKKYVK